MVSIIFIAAHRQDSDKHLRRILRNYIRASFLSDIPRISSCTFLYTINRWIVKFPTAQAASAALGRSLDLRGRRVVLQPSSGIPAGSSSIFHSEPIKRQRVDVDGAARQLPKYFPHYKISLKKVYDNETGRAVDLVVKFDRETDMQAFTIKAAKRKGKKQVRARFVCCHDPDGCKTCKNSR